MNTIIPDMSEAEYHANPRISKHGLDLIRKSPELYQYSKTAPRSAPGSSFRIGTATHTICLEPSLWESKTAITPDCDKRTKDGKAAWAEFSDANAGKLILTQEEADIANGCAQKVMATTGGLFRHTNNEHSLLFNI